ncbi:hypothetical protein HYFRA_00013941 [Hymenoscyphus fraxineus]|uniref:Uncharacterized protein n=1 Tax=Hymenoscyphus fraxineus TaxID=746836 RepID=A0A9N9L9G1_9HELO|nr:hypothetical protein HYFRA_00013941 [Hymenoscyphus fraxineus]
MCTPLQDSVDGRCYKGGCGLIKAAPLASSEPSHRDHLNTFEDLTPPCSFYRHSNSNLLKAVLDILLRISYFSIQVIPSTLAPQFSPPASPEIIIESSSTSRSMAERRDPAIHHDVDWQRRPAVDEKALVERLTSDCFQCSSFLRSTSPGSRQHLNALTMSLPTGFGYFHQGSSEHSAWVFARLMERLADRTPFSAWSTNTSL